MLFYVFYLQINIFNIYGDHSIVNLTVFEKQQYYYWYCIIIHWLGNRKK